MRQQHFISFTIVLQQTHIQRTKKRNIPAGKLGKTNINSLNKG